MLFVRNQCKHLKFTTGPLWFAPHVLSLVGSGAGDCQYFQTWKTKGGGGSYRSVFEHAPSFFFRLSPWQAVTAEHLRCQVLLLEVEMLSWASFSNRMSQTVFNVREWRAHVVLMSSSPPKTTVTGPVLQRRAKASSGCAT